MNPQTKQIYIFNLMCSLYNGLLEGGPNLKYGYILLSIPLEAQMTSFVVKLFTRVEF